MSRIQPFRGWRFDLTAAGAAGLDALLTPPYDVISPAQQAAYYARHPHNVVRVELARDEPGDDDGRNRFTRAAATLHDWQQRGVLRQEAQPAIYVLRERYTLPAGQVATRTGLIFRLRLAPWGQGILPHERTFPAAKADRLAVTIATGAQGSPIFVLYADPEDQAQAPLAAWVTQRPPTALYEDEQGVEHALWAVDDRQVLAAVTRALDGTDFYIADGHHRYETARNYQRWRRSGELPDTPPPPPLSDWSALPGFDAAPGPWAGPLQPFDYAWVYAARMEDPGLAVLPTHRCIHDLPDFDPDRLLAGLREHFLVTPVADDRALQAALAAATPEETVMALATSGAGPGYLLRLKDHPATTARLQAVHHPAVAAVDVAALQALVLGPLLGIGAEPGDHVVPDAAQRSEASAQPPEGRSPEWTGGGRRPGVEKRFLAFTPAAGEALEGARAGRYQAVFLVNPTPLAQLKAVADAGQVMPPKATYFYPKVPAGLVINCLE